MRQCMRVAQAGSSCCLRYSRHKRFSHQHVHQVGHMCGLLARALSTRAQQHRQQKEAQAPQYQQHHRLSHEQQLLHVYHQESEEEQQHHREPQQQDPWQQHQHQLRQQRQAQHKGKHQHQRRDRHHQQQRHRYQQQGQHRLKRQQQHQWQHHKQRRHQQEGEHQRRYIICSTAASCLSQKSWGRLILHVGTQHRPSSISYVYGSSRVPASVAWASDAAATACGHAGRISYTEANKAAFPVAMASTLPCGANESLLPNAGHLTRKPVMYTERHHVLLRAAATHVARMYYRRHAATALAEHATSTATEGSPQQNNISTTAKKHPLSEASVVNAAYVLSEKATAAVDVRSLHATYKPAACSCCLLTRRRFISTQSGTRNYTGQPAGSKIARSKTAATLMHTNLSASSRNNASPFHPGTRDGFCRTPLSCLRNTSSCSCTSASSLSTSCCPCLCEDTVFAMRCSNISSIACCFCWCCSSYCRCSCDTRCCCFTSCEEAENAVYNRSTNHFCDTQQYTSCSREGTHNYTAHTGPSYNGKCVFSGSIMGGCRLYNRLHTSCNNSWPYMSSRRAVYYTVRNTYKCSRCSGEENSVQGSGNNTCRCNSSNNNSSTTHRQKGNSEPMRHLCSKESNSAFFSREALPSSDICCTEPPTAVCGRKKQISSTNYKEPSAGLWCSDTTGSHTFRTDTVSLAKKSYSIPNRERCCRSVYSVSGFFCNTNGPTGSPMNSSYCTSSCSLTAGRREHGKKSRSLLSDPLVVASSFSVSESAYESVGHTQQNLLPIPLRVQTTLTEKRIQSQPCGIRIFWRALGQAFMVKKQQQVLQQEDQQEQQQQERIEDETKEEQQKRQQQMVTLVQGRGDIVQCDDVSVAATKRKTVSSNAAEVVGQQLRSLNEEAATLLKEAAHRQGERVSPTPQPLQVSGHEGVFATADAAAVAVQDHSALSRILPGDDHEVVEEFSLSKQQRIHRKPFLQEKHETNQGQKQKNPEPLQWHLLRQSYICQEPQRLPLKGEKLLQSIRQLPWARKLRASLYIVSSGQPDPDVQEVAKATNISSRAAREAVAPSTEVAATRATSAATETPTLPGKDMSKRNMPYGKCATMRTKSSTLLRTPLGETSADAAIEDHAQESAATEAAGFLSATDEAIKKTEAPATEADTAAAWWARHAPRYLGPVIKRVSRQPADVQLRMIQLALTHTPLQHRVCAPYKQHLQQQAQLMLPRSGSNALLKKQHQQNECRSKERPHDSSTTSRYASTHAAPTERTVHCIQLRETAGDATLQSATDTVPAGTESISEEDVTMFGAPFLWFTQDPRLPSSHRLWCVEQLAFWLHASGRPSALRESPRQQHQQQGRTPLAVHHNRDKPVHESQAHHRRYDTQPDQEEDEKRYAHIQGHENVASAAAQPSEERLLASTSWNEGCFQLSPQGDLQISDIRVWRSIGIAIRYLMHEGYMDNAAHMLYSMLSLLYDARAFPAPAVAPTTTRNPGACYRAGEVTRMPVSADTASARASAGLLPPPAGQEIAAGAPAAMTATMNGGLEANGCVAAPGMPSTSCVTTSSAACAGGSEGSKSLPAVKRASTSTRGNAYIDAGCGTRARELPCASTAVAFQSSADSLPAASPPALPCDVASVSVASASQGVDLYYSGGCIVETSAECLTKGMRKKPFFSTSSISGLSGTGAAEKKGDNISSCEESQPIRLTNEVDISWREPCSKGARRMDKMTELETAWRKLETSNSTHSSASVKISRSDSAPCHSLTKATSCCGSTSVSRLSAACDSERLARHLTVTRWRMSKPVWLKLLTHKQRLASGGEATDEAPEWQNAGGMTAPLHPHELEALALLSSLFFEFHDEVVCALTVLADALSKHQAAAAEQSADIVAPQNADSASAGAPEARSNGSFPTRSATSMAMRNRLVKKFAAARQASAWGQDYMRQYLARLRVVKLDLQSVVGQKSDHSQMSPGKAFAGNEWHRSGPGGRQWVAVLLQSIEAGAQVATKTIVPKQYDKGRASVSFIYHQTAQNPKHSHSEGVDENSRLAASASNWCGITTGGITAAPARKEWERELSGATDAHAAAAVAAAELRTFGLRTLVWYLRLQSHFYKVQSVPVTSSVCRMLTRLLRFGELQRLYPAESKADGVPKKTSAFSGSTTAAVSATAKPLTLFARRQSLPLPFSPAASATVSRSVLGPLQDGVIVSRMAPSAHDATIATPAAVLLAQVVEAVKAVHFYDHELLQACCDVLRPNVCLLPSQYACGVIFNLGCMGYSDPALASAVAHYLVDSGLLKTATKVEAMMQLLIGFSRLDFRDDRLTFACIDALMGMKDVLAFTCRPVSLFYLLHSISFHNVRCLPLLAKLLPTLQRFASVVPTNVAVLAFHDLVRNSVWPGPYRRLLVPRLVRELPSLAIATLAGATPLCWSLWGHFDVPLLLQLVQQFNRTRTTDASKGVLTEEHFPQRLRKTEGECRQHKRAEASVKGGEFAGSHGCERKAQNQLSRGRVEHQAGDEASLSCGGASTTLTLVKASTQFWSAFYCVQLLALTPRDFLPHVQAMEKVYNRGRSKQCRRGRPSNEASSYYNPSTTEQAPGSGRSAVGVSCVPSSATFHGTEFTRESSKQCMSPAFVYLVTPQTRAPPQVRFSPWRAGSLAGLKAAQILQTPEANWTPKSSTLHEEVLAACPHKVRAAAINEQPAGPYEVDLVVPPGVVAPASPEFTKCREGRESDAVLRSSETNREGMDR